MEYPSPRPPINGEINSFREDLDRGQRAVLIIDETRASNVRYSLSLSLWNGKVQCGRLPIGRERLET